MLVSIKQYADIVGISYWKIREMCLKGEIPAYKFGNRFASIQTKQPQALSRQSKW